jgi:hypothetical protein
MLIFPLYTHTSAFHENLGIDDNKASELYHANPNDPAIVILYFDYLGSHISWLPTKGRF